MIRAANYRDEIIAGIGSLLSVDARDLAPDSAAAWALRIKSWLRKGFDYWPFKELEITEERAFRQVLSPALNYLAGEEGFFFPQRSYFRALEAIAPGELPDTAPAKWKPFIPTDRVVAFEQYGKQTIGKVIAVNRCNPLRYLRRDRDRYRMPFVRSGDGVMVDTAGPTVWVTYQIAPPNVSAETYDELATYQRGSTIYDPITGDCYTARRTANNNPPSDTIYWNRQRMPLVLSEYVTHGVAANLAEDAQTKAYLTSEAEARIIAEINNESAQGVRHSYYSLEEVERYRWNEWEIPYTLVEVACAA